MNDAQMAVPPKSSEKLRTKARISDGQILSVFRLAKLGRAHVGVLATAINLTQFIWQVRTVA